MDAELPGGLANLIKSAIKFKDDDDITRRADVEGVSGKGPGHIIALILADSRRADFKIRAFGRRPLTFSACPPGASGL